MVDVYQFSQELPCARKRKGNEGGNWMKQIPSTLVLAAVCILGASWPSLQAWAEATPAHHYLIHGLYIIAGGLVGLQTSWWIHQSTPIQHVEESGVSS